MSAARLDHLVIGAASLEEGARYISETLGVDIPRGGEHSRMGTHNLLMRLGDGVYLEVIAVNPTAAAPNRPRWFGLDDPYVRAVLVQGPRLLTWVVRVGGIGEYRGLPYLGASVFERMSRDDLEWWISVSCDGGLYANGLLPLVIEWESENHPSLSMVDQGCRLRSLDLYHPNPPWLVSQLTPLQLQEPPKVHGIAVTKHPYLAVTLDTPQGARVLESFGTD